MPVIPQSLRGIFYMVAATVLWTATMLSVRVVAERLHPLEIVFFRNLFGVLVLLPFFARQGLAVFRTQRLGLQALRGGLNSVSLATLFIAIPITPLALATALDFSCALFGAVLAVLVLGETLRFRRMAALAVGFGGILVVLQPGVADIQAGSILVLISSLLVGISFAIIKVLSRTDSSVTTTLYTGLFSTPLTLVAMIPVWQVPGLADWPWLVAIGAFGGLSYVCIAQSFREADMTAVLPFDFLRLIWSTFAAFWLFFEVPSVWTWIGALMIFSAGLVLGYRETREEERPRPATG
ncbi:MAG: DMT family transporter [Rhodospirillales bacterium]|nr:DMT family transporter [Rhodospirillales bacterium]